MNEVIIDGVNVAECSLYCNGNCLRLMTDKNSIEDVNCNSYCDYGAYARQEQFQRAKAELEQYKIKYPIIDCYRCKHSKENERLKAENEKLKERVKQLDEMTGIYSVRLMKKYRKALEEIKEIATETSKNIKIVYNRGYHITLRKILKKINEVLND